ncbi:glycoside hydrolase family 31 protein [Rhizodiscina lignyota]|uniref:alpha-glucosidase n=1 Tax=Rhizodiscina lignyota TaxID=1504668 RepID=A0A9P4I5G3_9PEZI|nr:glycoside hydrolase family 31 protein [Rhizodiscina lignyota]
MATLNSFLSKFVLLSYLTCSFVNGQATTTTGSIGTVTIDGHASTFSAQFTVPAGAQNGVPVLPNIDDPKAVDAQTVCPGYKASNVKQTNSGLTASLSLAGKACNVYGTDIESLSLTVEYQSDSRLSVNIQPTYLGPKNTSWFVLADNLVPKPPTSSGGYGYGRSSDLKVDWGNSPSFWFSVTRESTNDILFSTKGNVIVYENQFLEIVSTLPEDYNLYGLGEHIHGLRLGNNYTATLYAADVGDPIDLNIYGSHPFYLDTRYYSKGSNGKHTYIPQGSWQSSNGGYVGHGSTSGTSSYSHGVYLRNAHGQDILLRPDSITWRTLGGAFEFYFYDGPSALDVTRQYQTSATGLPAMQQYFGFGYHQCRWGYANWTQLQEVVDNFKRLDIPLETIWTDIDYMKLYRDFTNDPVTFSVPEGKEFLAKLHANNQHYVPIVDSAIYIPNPDNETDAYPTYNRGHEAGVFLLNPGTDEEYIGDVWPGYTVFPDWQASKAVEWWSNELVNWYKDIHFDGIWIDMSEVSSFCVGSCGTGNLSLNPVHPPFGLPGEPGNKVFDYPEGFNITNATEAAAALSSSSSQASANAAATPAGSPTSTTYLRTTPTPGVRDINHPPYVINNVQGDLAVHAVSPNATHHDGVVEYDVHNLFGHQILNATYQGLLSVFPGKRPFIIGRSTFASTGRWAGHWGGDNASKWYYMYFSIPQALSFALFGIPMFGVDTCGFNGNSDYELCSRWMQLSAFFPFYRNHNEKSTNSQEPYIWSSVTTATKTAMNIRYNLLPYIYTLFYNAHTKGDTVMRALAWEFPSDPSLANADRQFLLGPSILVTPVLDQGASSVKGVFPGVGDGEVWYDWYTGSAVSASPGENKTIEAPLGHIPVYVRGGSILPMQEPGYTTTECRKNPWKLLVALDERGSASGEVYIDDGESLEPSETLLVDFSVRKNGLSVKVKGNYKVEQPLSNVTVLGVGSKPGNVKLNGKAVSGVSYESESKVAYITGLEDLTKGGAFSGDWTLSW